MNEAITEIDIQKIRRSNLCEFEKMYNKYVKKVYSYTYKILQNNADCEEVTQDVFVNMWQKRDVIRSEKVVWTIAKRKCIDYLRKKKTFFLSPMEWSTLYSVSNSEKKVWEKEECESLINRLSIEEKEVTLLILRGVKRQEIAQLLEIPLGTVDSRLNRIKRKLQRR